MNRLPTEKRNQVLNMLVEGMSMRATSRVAEVSFNAVARLLVDAGQACAEFRDKHVLGLTSKYIEADEIWSSVRAKRLTAEERGIPDAGDMWTWTALDPETKLIVSWLVGPRDGPARITYCGMCGSGSTATSSYTRTGSTCTGRLSVMRSQGALWTTHSWPRG